MDYAVAVYQIIEAESLAKRKAAETNEQIRAMLSERLHEEIAKMEQDYNARAAARLDKLRAFEEDAAGKQHGEVEQAHARAMEALEAHYAENRADWVRRLYTRITGDCQAGDAS